MLLKYAGKALPQDKKYINSGGRKVGFLTPAFRPFRPGGKSGIPVSDYFPYVRSHADKLAVVRSCHTDSHAINVDRTRSHRGRSYSVYSLWRVSGQHHERDAAE